MAPVSDMKPIAEGNFNKTPFAHILVFLFEKQMTGSLLVRSGQTEMCIYFRDGTPAKIRTSVSHRGLGEVLALIGLISEEELARCNTRITSKGGLVGQTLIELGAIDMSQLVRGLREQMLLKLTDVFALKDAAYAFYDRINELAGFGPDEVFPIHPFPVLMAGLRTWGHILDFERVLTTIEHKWVSVNADLETVRSYRLTPEEKRLVGTLLSRPLGYSEIMSNADWDPNLARNVVYVLLITKRLAVSDTPPVDTGNEVPSRVSLTSIAPSTAAKLAPEIAAVKQRLVEKAEAIAVQNYYEMLEIEPNASIEETRRAFFKLSKIYHPDRVPRELREDINEMVAYLFSNLSEAHSVLMDPFSREQYDAVLFGSEERSSEIRAAKTDEDAIRSALEAENLYQRALVFVNQRRYDKAAELVGEARELAPEEGEYLALAVHLEALKLPPDADFENFVRRMRNASDKCPKSERVTFFFAELLKRAGRFAEAKARYKKVLEINPHNIYAARNVRLMDKEAERTSKKPSGIFKRFFK